MMISFLGRARGRNVIDFFEDVYRRARLARSPKETIRQYRCAIRHLKRILGRTPRMEDLNETVLQELVCQHTGSNATVNKTLRHLLALTRFACERGVLKKVPKIKPLREPKRVPQAWTVEQVELIMRIAAMRPPSCWGQPCGRYWVSLISFLYYSGVRIQAALSIRQVDVDLPGRRVLVRAETQKTFQDQVLRIHEDTATAIQRIWEPHRLLVWPMPRVQALRGKLKEILIAANLPHDRYHSFHAFRRTTYSYSKLVGHDPSWQMGHSCDLSRHYEDPQITRLCQAADVLPRLKMPG